MSAPASTDVETGSITLNTHSAVDGSPLQVRAEVAPSSIVVRIGDGLVLSVRPKMTLEEGRLLARQLTSACGEVA